MDYQFKHKETIHNVKVTKETNSAEVLVDDKQHSVDYRKIGFNRLSVISDNKPYTVFMAEDEKNKYVAIHGKYFVFDKMESAEAKSFEDTADVVDGKQIVKPPMPGSIVKVNVGVNTEVKKGDTLIIVEAMKMEHAISALINGKVTCLNVKQGEMVDADKVLMEICSGDL